MKLVNKYEYTKPWHTEKWIVHTLEGIYIESHFNESRAKRAVKILNGFNVGNGYSENITYSHLDDVELEK